MLIDTYNHRNVSINSPEIQSFNCSLFPGTQQASNGNLQ